MIAFKRDIDFHTHEFTDGMLLFCTCCMGSRAFHLAQLMEDPHFPKKIIYRPIKYLYPSKLFAKSGQKCKKTVSTHLVWKKLRQFLFPPPPPPNQKISTESPSSSINPIAMISFMPLTVLRKAYLIYHHILFHINWASVEFNRNQSGTISS